MDNTIVTIRATIPIITITAITAIRTIRTIVNREVPIFSEFDNPSILAFLRKSLKVLIAWHYFVFSSLLS